MQLVIAEKPSVAMSINKENIKAADEQKPLYGICREGAKVEPGYQRVDKLLCG